MKDEKRRIRWTVLSGFLFLLLSAGCQTQGARTAHVRLEQTTDVRTVAASVDSTRIRRTIVDLAGFGTRMTGYPGATQAAHYLVDRLRDIGVEEVELEEFIASVPLDEGGELTLPDAAFADSTGALLRNLPLYAVWPNLVRTSTLPAEGLDAKLYYVGAGDWADFNGIDPQNAIVLMDFNSGVNWQNAAQLGARAAIFAEPDRMTRVDGEEKYLQVPINFPRFFMKKEHARPLIDLIRQQGPQHVRAKARMTWKRLPAYNVLGKITGTHPILKDEAIVLESYYDSMSPVPAVSPGANQASGTAALVEMAHYFKTHPPARTVYFLATSGHFLSLSGVNDFAHRHTRKNEYFARQVKEPINMKLFIGLDLSSARDQIGVYYAGILFAGNSFEKQRFFTPFGKTFMAHAGEITSALGLPNDILMNVITPTQGIQSSEFFPAGNIGLDGELIFWSGFPALSFATIFDARVYVDTPIDTPDRVHYGHLYTQTAFMTVLLAKAINNPDLFPDFKMQLEDRFVRGRIRVVEFDPKKSYIPSTPKPGAVVRFRRYNKSISGVKNEIFVMADSNGVAECTELEAGRVYPTEGYVLDPETGNIIYAPDRGPCGKGAYPLEIRMDWLDKEKPTVVFRCEATNIYDLVDPRFLKRLNEAVLLNESGTQPIEFGLTFQEGGWTTGNTYEEDTAALFVRPGTRFKLTMSSGLIGRRLVLTNASAENPEGIGFPAGQLSIPYTSYQVAQDMWHLDDARIRALKSAGVGSDRLELFHQTARQLLNRAETARQSLEWDSFIKHARAAWGYESRAYPDATDTANDVVSGVLFYMALVIPFAYALERLLFGFANIYRRIATTFGIFLASYFILRVSHPAFQISATPDIVLLAFITLTLALIVIWLISARFTRTMQHIRHAGARIHNTDVQRSSALGTAFALGIGNMRKRKARTMLTCLTLILLVFTVLSFTSVQTYLRIQKVSRDAEARYTGFLVRNLGWEPLQKQTHQYLMSEFGSREEEDKDIVIAPRSWYSSAAPGIKTFIKVERDVASAPAAPETSYRTAYASAMLGLTPQETSVSGLDGTLLAGRWFRPGERAVCILPADLAELLSIRREDVEATDVHIFGQPHRVIGLFDPATFENLRDLDGEPLTPVDFTATGQDLLTQLAQKNYDEEPLDMAEFKHQLAANTILAPQPVVDDLGGTLRSVAVRFASETSARTRIDRFLPRLGIPVIASVDGKVAVYSSIALSSLSGLGNMFIPLLVAALIILNTMMNAVYERFREIGVYSAVGLAPVHIGALFMAEACVYAVVGGMAGYLIGQTVASGITEYQLLAGLTLNYSSLSAVASTALVMSVVLLSTVYPARKAAQMAVPDVNRQWSFPEPQGNLWSFEFPFTISRAETPGLCTYLVRLFESYEESALGSFMASGVRMTRKTENGAETYTVAMNIWLAPYDMGVSQRVSLRAAPAQGEHDLYAVWVDIHRESGDVDSWQRLNRRFLNALRKQFLIWRTIDHETKMEYASEGRRMKCEV
ncbi:MAG: M28 family peptidase [candidate division Zixibacteria bacterium]|nr:M28 family peptidase [candidate division Zixibacteria bacterium]